MRIIELILSTTLLGVSASISAADFVTVGSDPGCDFRFLQNAIDANNREIHVTSHSIDFSQAPIQVAGKTLRLYGGYPDCNKVSVRLEYDGTNPETLSLIDASGHPGVSGVQITGSADVDIRNFRISNVDALNNSGGGISFISSGTAGKLTLQFDLIDNNQAKYGGGVFYSGNAIADNFGVYDHVFVQGNRSVDYGGGIDLEGHTHLIDISPQTQISGNQAGFNNPGGANAGTDAGGGLALRQHAIADIGSPGYGDQAVIDSNKAFDGAGIYTEGGTNLRLYSTVPGQLTRIEHNTGDFGAAVFADSSSDGQPKLCGHGVGFNSNTGINSVVYAFDGDGSLNFNQLCADAVGQVDCVAGKACVTANDNQVASGSIFFFGRFPFGIDRLEMNGNTAVSLIQGNSDSFLTNCSVVGNIMYNVVSATEPSTISSCTIADNQFSNGGSVFGTATASPPIQQFTIRNSIIWQGNVPTVQRPGAATEISDSILQEVPDQSAFGTYAGVTHALPQFVNPAGAGGNYALSDGSPAIDYTANCAQATDFNGNPRGVVIADPNKACDIGAFERQSIPPGKSLTEQTEDFETFDPWAKELPGGWQMRSDFDARENWSLVTSGISGFGTFSVHADDLGARGEAFLTSPPFIYDAGAQLVFDQDFDIDTDHDGVILEINRGPGFIDINAAGGTFVTGNYNSVLRCDGTFAVNPLLGSCSRPNVQAWSGNTAGVSHVIINLPSTFSGVPVRLRWTIGTDGGIGRPGYTLDNVHVVTDDDIFKGGFEQAG